MGAPTMKAAGLVLGLWALASSRAGPRGAYAVAAAGAGPTGNPIVGHELYVNPSYRAELATSIATATGKVRENLAAIREAGSAYWLDVKSKVLPGSGLPATSTAEGILADAATHSPAPLVTLIVYNLPNRDCAAKASAGQICCSPFSNGTCDYLVRTAGGRCDDGLREYREEYIDPLAAHVTRYCSTVPMVLVIEPDSLPNLATNLKSPRCGNPATVSAYKQGVSYAVRTLAAACPAATLYLDAAHGGWLGWKTGMLAFVKVVKGLGITQHLRGFSTNVANYQPLGLACPSPTWCLSGDHDDDPCCFDPCKLCAQFNPANNEMNFATLLAGTVAAEIPSFQPHFIIDTGRNGQDDFRADCRNWCNVRGAGMGPVPTTDTLNRSLVDAYMWLKTPGESDGCSKFLPPDGTVACKRFDVSCASKDSLGSHPEEELAPEAGNWFDQQVKMLARNARFEAPTPPPPTTTTPGPTSTTASGDCQEGEGNCWVSKCCVDMSMSCFEKWPGVAVCKKSCNPGWDQMRCTLLSKPLPAPVTTSVAAPAPQGACSNVGENCMVSRCCNDHSSKCFEKDPGWAECLRSCKPGIDPSQPAELQSPWTCSVLGADKSPGAALSPGPGLVLLPSREAPVPLEQKRGSEGDFCSGSKCCADSLKCFERYPGYAICKKSCSPSIDRMSCALVAPRVETATAPPTTQQTSPAPAAESTCAGVFQQCGGISFGGPRCCESGCSCVASGLFYSQCNPPTGKSACVADHGPGGSIANPLTATLAHVAEENPFLEKDARQGHGGSAPFFDAASPSSRLCLQSLAVFVLVSAAALGVAGFRVAWEGGLHRLRGFRRTEAVEGGERAYVQLRPLEEALQSAAALEATAVP